MPPPLTALRPWAGRLLSAAGAAVLLGSLYVHWYSVPPGSVGGARAVDAWDAFGRLDAVLVALGALSLLAAAIRPSPLTPRIRVLAGVAAAALVAWKLVSPPNELDSVLGGPFVALVGAAAMVVGGLADLRGARPGAGPRQDPAARRAGTQPAVDEGAGAAIYQAGEIRAARVESLRALAALSVVAVHVFIFSEATLSEPLRKLFNGGAFGVLFFFALSGYLLFRPFARHLVDGVPGLRLREYAVNRALRVLPLYYFVVAVLLTLEVNGGRPEQWWRFALLIENFSRDTVLRADSPMWSLAVEIHFYILLPLVALLVGWLARGSRSRAAVAIAGLGLVSLVLRLLTVSFEPSPDFRWSFSLATLFFFFAVGMLLSLLRMAWEERPPRWLRGKLASSDLWMLASAPLWVLAMSNKKFEFAVAAAAFLVLAACVLPLRAGVLTRALDWRPLAVLGIASYSLYLWHVPLISAVADNPVKFTSAGGVLQGHPHEILYLGVAALPVCIAVALVSYAIIESPFLRLRRQWGARTGRS